MKKKVAEHILPTSSNLMAICFAIFSYIKVGAGTNITLLDDLITVPILMFFTASMLSYFSLRTEEPSPRSDLLEKIADVCFILGLVVLTGLSLGVILKLI